MSGNRTGAFIGGLALGAVLGGTLGLLLAPRSGRETRRILKKTAADRADDITTSIQDQTAKLLDAAQQSLDETLLKLQKAIAAGKEAMLQKRQELNQSQSRNGEGSHYADARDLHANYVDSDDVDSDDVDSDYLKEVTDPEVLPSLAPPDPDWGEAKLA